MLIVLTGPESTGKTTLAQALANHFGAEFVAEIARGYLAQNTSYLPSDLLRIAHLHASMEASLARNKPAILDTDLQVLAIWWRERFGALPERLARAYRMQSPRFYLLCEPDIDWQPDPLRENPYDRARLFTLYRDDLEARALPYGVVRGHGEERTRVAIELIDDYRARSAASAVCS